MPLEIGSFGTYNDGLLGVKKGTKAAFYDLDGNKIIDYKIDIGVRDADIAFTRSNYPGFREGLAKAYDETTQKYGFIDKSGAWKIKPSFTVANDFYEGYAIVIKYINYQDVYFLIDKTGTTKFQFPANLIPDYPQVSEGMIAVRDKKTRSHGYLDITGKLVVPCKYSVSFPFSEGLARVNGPNEYNEYKWGYIDKTGKLVIEHKFSYEPGDFKSGLALITDTHHKYGYIDKQGNVVIEPQYSLAFPFENGVSVARTEEDHSNFSFRIIDTKGNTLNIIKDFHPYGGFKEGFAIVSGNGGYNYIDTKGNLLLKERISTASPFNDGAAYINWNDENYKYHEGFIDTTGKVRIIKVESKY